MYSRTPGLQTLERKRKDRKAQGLVAWIAPKGDITLSNKYTSTSISRLKDLLTSVKLNFVNHATSF